MLYLALRYVVVLQSFRYSQVSGNISGYRMKVKVWSVDMELFLVWAICLPENELLAGAQRISPLEVNSPFG